MNSMAFRIVRRWTFILALVAGPSVVVINDGIIPLWLNAFGVIGMAFGFGALFLNWQRSAKFFTRERIGQAQVHAIALQGFALTVILGAAQAIHLRTIGHATAFLDTSATIVIWVIRDLTMIALFLTAGQYDETASWNRMGRAALLIGAIVVAAFLFAAHDRRGLFTSEPEQTIVTPEGAHP